MIHQPAFWVMIVALLYIIMGAVNVREWLTHIEKEHGDDALNLFQGWSVALASLTIFFLWLPIELYAIIRALDDWWNDTQ